MEGWTLGLKGQVKRLLAVSVLALTALSCAPPDRAVPWVFVGDSVLFTTDAAVRATLPAGGTLLAQIGADPYAAAFGTGTPLIELVAWQAGSIQQGGYLFVQDDGSSVDRATFDAFVADVQNRTPADVCVVWVTSYSEYPSQDDEVVRASIEARGPHRSAVADWGTVAAQGGLTKDGLHPNEAGSWAFAQEAAAAMGRCL